MVAKEREILTEQAGKEGKSRRRSSPRWSKAGCASRSARSCCWASRSSRIREQTVEKLLKAAGAAVLRFERFEVGAGIEKKQEDFVAEVMAQVKRSGRTGASSTDTIRLKNPAQAGFFL